MLPALVLAQLATFASPVWTQTSELAPDGGGANQFFGSTLALAGSTLMVGAPEKAMVTGAVYVFDFTDSGGTPGQMLSQAGPESEYAESIALSDTLAVVGAPQGVDFHGAYAGTAFVYTLVNGSWTYQTALAPSERAGNDAFGASVAMMGSSIVVGAPGATGHATSSGAVYVFTASGSTWVEAARLTATDGAFGDELASAVAVDGTTILAVAPYRGGTPGGAQKPTGYLFTASGPSWAQQTEFAPAVGVPANLGKVSAILSGNTAFLGISTSGGPGQVSVFSHSSSGWTEAQTIKGPDGIAADFFGAAVAFSGDTLLVGQSSTDAAYFFRFTNLGAGFQWNLAQQVGPMDTLGLDPMASTERVSFGSAVAISGSTAYVGGNHATVGPNAGVGLAYGFTLVDGGACNVLGLCSPDASPTGGGGASSSGSSGASSGDGGTSGSPHSSGGCSCTMTRAAPAGGPLPMLVAMALLRFRRARGRCLGRRASRGRCTGGVRQ